MELMELTELMRRERGAVYVEFVLAFPVVLLMFLCMVQLALIGTARLAVHHAATVGARAAIVVLPDDPKHYLGESRLSLRAPKLFVSRKNSPFRGGRNSAALRRLVAGGKLGGIHEGGGPERESRSAAIRRAVVMVLAPYAAPWLGGHSVHAAVDGAAGRLANGLTAYPDLALSVTYPRGKGARQYHERTLSGDDVTVRVAYLVYCAVPVAARLVCGGKKLSSLLGDGNARPKDPDLRAIENQAGLRALLRSGARFSLLKAEATLPIQSARYEGT